MAEDETYVCNQLYSIPLADLEPDHDQPRKYFDPAALEELAASIARNNVMTPIFFRIDAGRKVIVAGGCKDFHEGGTAESASFPAKDERGRREGHHYRGGVRGRGLIAAAVLRGSVVSKRRNRQNECNRHICCLNAYFRLFSSYIN
jgi:hypothetical protein